MKRMLLLFSIGMYTLSMAGCGSPLETSPASGLSGSGSGASQTAAEPEESSRETSSAAVTLYIGLEGEFAEYQVNYTGERAEDGRIPAAQVLSAMTELTGWNLDLTVPVESGKDGVTVTFADTCTLLSGGSDGETAEESAQEWWKLTKGGEMVNTGVDATPIADGDAFELTFMVGYDEF